jgi:SAM-dependent methyltransferase
MNLEVRGLETTQEPPDVLRRIYARRFGDTAAYRDLVWQVLTKRFFHRWIPADATVLDLGCGFGEFVNNIRARHKMAMDLNAEAATHLRPNVEFINQDCSQPWPLQDGALDVVFSSNFFEHLPDKRTLMRTLGEAFRCLKPGGRLIAMGPNIRFLPGAYWDFFDHHVMLTDASLAEALHLNGFESERIEPRFLPYTLVNARRYPLVFVRLYLAIPLLWRLKGKQFLVIARKPINAITSIWLALEADAVVFVETLAACAAV